MHEGLDAICDRYMKQYSIVLQYTHCKTHTQKKKIRDVTTAWQIRAWGSGNISSPVKQHGVLWDLSGFDECMYHPSSPIPTLPPNKKRKKTHQNWSCNVEKLQRKGKMTRKFGHKTHHNRETICKQEVIRCQQTWYYGSCSSLCMHAKLQPVSWSDIAEHENRRQMQSNGRQTDY
jgi:hypothetical protein